MYKFFVDRDQIDTEGKRVYITGEDRNHIKNVLRMRIGEEAAVMVPGDENEYRCAISGYTPDAVELELLFVKECDVELPCEVVICQGLPKADKMETVITKSVELGASAIIPVATTRSVVKLDGGREEKKISRWNAISEAAAKQSKRAVIPEVLPVMSMGKAIDRCRDFDVKLIPYELSDHDAMDDTRKAVENIKAGSKVAVFVGPEGGFSEEEVREAIQAGFVPITLGHRILRTETAAMVVLSWIIYNTEGKR